MSHWNYRVLKHTHLNNEWVGIHEVYYDDNGEPNACSTDPTSPYGETEQELQNDLDLMKKAFEKPVMYYSFFEDLSNKKEPDYQ